MKRFGMTAAFLAGIAIILTATSCATTQEITYPLWYTDEGLEETYPSASYIREIGTGKTKQDAENDAVAYISRYFETEVDYSYTNRLNAVSTDDETTVTETTDINKSSSSRIKLFGIKYSENFYDKKQGEYRVVAYINKKEAYEVFKPTITGERDKFMALYDKAEDETDYLLKCSFYKSAYNAGNAFKDDYDFGIKLNSKAVKADFEKDIEVMNGIPAKTKEFISRCTMSLNVTGDYGNSNYSAILQVFSDMGFAMRNGDPMYTVEAIINDNDSVYKMKSKETHTIYPSINLYITSKDGKNVYSFSYKTEQKTTNFTLEDAQRNAYPVFASEMKDALKADFEDKTGVSALGLLY